MIPTWLINTFAAIGFVHFALLLALALCGAWQIVRAHLLARRFARQLVAQIAKAQRENEARMADEWVLREVAESMERKSA